MKSALFAFFLCSAAASAEQASLPKFDKLEIGGETFLDVTVLKVYPDKVTLQHSTGAGSFKFSQLPPEVVQAIKAPTATSEPTPKDQLAMDPYLPPYPTEYPKIVTLDGREYTDIKIKEVTAWSLEFSHSSGMAKLPFSKLPPGIQKDFHYDAEEARRQLTKLEEEQHLADELAREQALADAKSKPQEKSEEPSPAPPGAAAQLIDPDVICKEPKPGTMYHLPIELALSFDPQHGRRFVIPLELTKTMIQVGICHGFDNSADGGMKWEIRTAGDKRKIKSGIAKSRGWDFGVLKDIPDQHLLLILTDDDSNFSGKDPGNGFVLRVRER